MNLATRLPEIWYGALPLPLWLRALVPVYRGLLALHRAPYALGWRQPRRLPVPVIVVGNLTAGGTGKTPLVIALIEALRAHGHAPGVISRGYGVSAATPRLLDVSSDAATFGDEPVLLQRTTAAPVAIGRDRVAAGRLLLAEHACDVIVADDGLQHYPLFRNVEICVIDGVRRFGNGSLLPAGPLREPLSRLGSIDFRVCNDGQPQDGEISMRLIGDTAISMADTNVRKALRDFAGRSAHAVAGIGNPARFFALLRAAGINAIEHALPDHHAFREADIAFDDDLPVLLTEKDAVKCGTFARKNLWYVPVHANLPESFFDAVTKKAFAR